MSPSDVRPGPPPPRGPGLSGRRLALLYVAVAALPLAAARFSGLDPVDPATEAATGLGLVAGAMLLLQFLGSGRFERLSSRIGLDRTKAFHRIAGATLLVLALAHPLGHLLATALEDPAAAGQRAAGLLAAPRTRSGVLALAALAVVVLLPFWRERLALRYERWRASHGLLALLAAGLVLHHAVTVGSYSAEPVVLLAWGLLAAAALAATVVLYVLRPLRMWREPWHVERVAPDGDGTWRLELLGPPATRLRFAPGQFVWITLAPHRPPFHDHPFSIASAPAELPRLRLIVRAAGDCTRAFGAVAPGTRVAIDGPHGSFVLGDDGDTVLMIAGGVGIAPLLGMIEHAAATGDRRRFRLLYAARHAGAFAGIDRLRTLAGRIDLEVTLVADTPSPAEGVVAGPLTASRLAAAVAAPERTVAYVCGPPSLMAMATDALLDLGVPARAIHYERFDDLASGGRLDRRRLRRALAVMAALAAIVAAFALR